MVYEPLTLLTDVLLAAWALFLGLQLRRGADYCARLLWSWALIMTAVTALAGGLWHGYSPYWSPSLVTAWWRGVMVIVAVADVLFGWAIIGHSLKGPWRKKLNTLVALKLGIYLLLLWWVDGFWLAVADYLPTLLLILALQVSRLRHEREAQWLTMGVLTAFVAAGVQVAEVRIHTHFNHNDLYHLIQGLALYFLYRGGRLFKPPVLHSADGR